MTSTTATAIAMIMQTTVASNRVAAEPPGRAPGALNAGA
jgi:hypothetical protein